MNPNHSASSAISQPAAGQNGLVTELHAQFAESAKLERAIKANFKSLMAQ